MDNFIWIVTPPFFELIILSLSLSQPIKLRQYI